MPALLSTWLGLLSLVGAAVMVVFRPAFHDYLVVLILYFGSPGSMCLAGMVLWAYRKEDGLDPAIAAQRLQAKVAIALSLTAAALVYGLVAFGQPVRSVLTAT